jgi:hypothetical protein
MSEKSRARSQAYFAARAARDAAYKAAREATYNLSVQYLVRRIFRNEKLTRLARRVISRAAADVGSGA